MILSDRTIREELAAGRIVIDPLGEGCIQPSSVDLHVDRYFRVFRNHTMRVIDVKEDQENLTELVEMLEDEAFILHPGEFVLGSTAERVRLPNDLVARLEGKSSLGRLGLLIHSSLPGSERVMVLDDTGLRLRPIEEVVRKQVRGSVVGFDPTTLEVGYHEITGWYEGPPDRIFEVVLGSGRRVRVTAGHNLFTLGRDGEVRKVRTAELVAGSRIAIPRTIPDPHVTARLDLLALVPDPAPARFVIEGPVVDWAFQELGPSVTALLSQQGITHVPFYRERRRLPLDVLKAIPEAFARIGPDDRITVRGSKRSLPLVIDVDSDLAWLLGLYVAEGCRRQGQVTISNSDQAILDRAQIVLETLGVPVHRSVVGVTAMSVTFSHLIEWLEPGHHARQKQVPPVVFGWPQELLAAFMEGFVDGDGSRESTRTSLWTSSDRLVDDMLYLAARMGRRASASLRASTRYLHQVSLPIHEHKLLTAVPLPDRLLVQLRKEAGLDQCKASREMGFRNASDLNNIERRSGRDAVRLPTLARFVEYYREVAPGSVALQRLEQLTHGGLLWDTVVQVRDTDEVETIFDLEVRPSGRHIENFLAGSGGIFVSNTAGFVDAGWDGHLTLELSNVANLPITLYPGMKIGQISFLRMTTPADTPYGSKAAGSKYQGQRGPTPSRYSENFRPRET